MSSGTMGGPSTHGRAAMPFAAPVLAFLLVAMSAALLSQPASAQPLIQQAYPVDNITTYEGQTVEFSIELYSNINASAAIIQWARGSSPVIGQGTTYEYTPDFNSSGKTTVSVIVAYNGSTAMHTWNLTVIEVKQRFTIVGASPVGEIKVHELGTMDFSVTVKNPANDTLIHRWYIDDELQLGINRSEYSYAPGLDDAGARKVRAEVESGDHTENISWKVTVLDALEVRPAGPQAIREGDSVTFAVLAPEMTDADIKWSLDGSATPMTGKTYTYKPDFVASGTHTLKLNTTDKLSYAWTITVDDVDRAPTVAQGALIKGQVNKAVKFTGTASDPDNDMSSYEWDFDGDGTFDFASDRQESTMHTYKKAGLYMAVFKVTDDHGETATMVYPVQVSQPTTASPWLAGSVILGVLIILLIVWIVVDATKARKRARLEAAAKERERAEVVLRARAAKSAEGKKPRPQELPLFEDIPRPVEGKAADRSMVPYEAKMADRGQEAEGAVAEDGAPGHVESAEAAGGGAVAEGSEVSKAQEKEELDVLLKSLASKTGTKAELKSKKASAEAGAEDIDHELGPHMRKGKKVKVQPKGQAPQRKVAKKEVPKEDLKATGMGADSGTESQASDEVDEVMQKLVDMGLAERKKKQE